MPPLLSFPSLQRSRAFGRVCFGGLSLLCLWVSGVPAGAQTAPGRAEQVPLVYVLEDADANLVPDRLGQRFEVEGYVTMEPQVARRDGDEPWFYVTIEDDSTGIRLLTQDGPSLSGLRVGSGIIATGVLTHRCGSEELFIEGLRVTPREVGVEPLDVFVRDVAGEALMHRLVRVQGTFWPFDLATRTVILEDRTGSVEVRLPSWLMADGRLPREVLHGGPVTVVGIIGQADLEPPFDGGYRLQPRNASDLTSRASPPLLEIALVLLFISLSIGLASFAHQTRWTESMPTDAHSASPLSARRSGDPPHISM